MPGHTVMKTGTARGLHCAGLNRHAVGLVIRADVTPVQPKLFLESV